MLPYRITCPVRPSILVAWFMAVFCAGACEHQAFAADAPDMGAEPDASTPAATGSGNTVGDQTPGTTDEAPIKVPMSIEAIDVEGATLLDRKTIEQAVYPHVGPDRTTDDIEAARAAVEAAYQKRGYSTVIVEIGTRPEGAGLVRIVVTENALGRLRIVGSRFHSPEVIRSELSALKEGEVPNWTTFEKQLAAAGNGRDRTIIPQAPKPGTQPNSFDLTLKVQDRFPLHASVDLNNDHSADTSDLRLTAQLSYANLWQAGHTITGTYVVSPEDTAETTVFSGSYLAPLRGTPWSLLIQGYTSNSNVATLGGTNVLGDGYAIGARIIYQLPSWKQFMHSVTFGFDYKSLNQVLDLSGINPSLENQTVPIAYVPLSVNYALQYYGDSSSASLNAGVTFGLRGLGSRAATFEFSRFGAKANFVHFNLDADLSVALPHDFLATARLSGQVASQPLVTGEQFAIGGHYTVRGFLQSEALGDDGITGGLEISSPSLAGFFGKAFTQWRLYGFFDAAFARLQQPLADQVSQAELYSAGIGTRLKLFDAIDGNISVAFPLRDGMATLDRNGKSVIRTKKGDPKAVFSVRAAF